MSTIHENLHEAERVLADAGVAEAKREAASLLAFALRKDKTFLIAHPEYELNNGEREHYSKVISRRAAREPFQYITGVQEFYGLEFEVTPDVLIPRSETEMVVEAAVNVLSTLAQLTFCEVGIGSGCIAVSVLHRVKNVRAVGLDISPTALAVARRNAEKNRVADRLDLRRSDVFAGLNDERFDLIASNPPYVPIHDIGGLQEEVRDYEPQTALTDGGDGLSIVRRIVVDAPRFLLPAGTLLMEIGFSQYAKVAEMFEPNIWKNVEFLPDLQGIPRMVEARLK
jgi:release factor glutamine methyltransferase